MSEEELPEPAVLKYDMSCEPNDGDVGYSCRNSDRENELDGEVSCHRWP
jgi:hypothetical protein